MNQSSANLISIYGNESRNVHPFYMFTPNFSKEDVSHPGCFTPGKFTPQIFHTPDYSPLRMFHPPWRIFHPPCIIIYSPHRSFTPNSPCSPPIGGNMLGGETSAIDYCLFFHPCTCLPHKYILLSSCHIHRPRRQLTA